MVVVDEAAPVVDPWRQRYAPTVIAARLPPHITLLYPFVPGDSIDAPLLGELQALYAGFPAFAFGLTRVEEFPGAIWLAPEPSGPFEALCRATWERYPEWPPYGGAVAEPVPHLTIAEHLGVDNTEAAAAVRAGLGSALPVRSQATDVTLLEQSGGVWRARERLPLGGS